MAVLFTDGFDRYGPTNTNDPQVRALLVTDWSSIPTGAFGTFNVIAGLSSAGYAINIVGAAGGGATISKTLPGNYARLIGGVRFSCNLGAVNAGVLFYDASTIQSCVTINATTGTISVRTGGLTGTAIATSTATVSANSTHYLEWDITFGNSAAYQVWLDGTSIMSGTGDTTSTANNTASAIALAVGQAATQNTSFDDLYVFDTSGSTNNVVLLTNPRIETSFPTSDSAVQFSPGAVILGTNNRTRTASVGNSAVNQLRLMPFTPAVNITLNSISVGWLQTSATIQVRPVVYNESAGVPNTLMSSGSTLTGITNGVINTLPLTTPQALTGGTRYWLGFMCDVAATMMSLDGGTATRTATSTFASGAPGTAPATTADFNSTMIYGNGTATANWNASAQNPPPGSLSYVYDSVVAHEDLYVMNSLSTTPANVYAVAVKAYAARSDAGSRTMSVHLKSGATDATGGSFAPGSSFGWAAAYWDRDPNGTVAWTASALAATTAGFKVDA